jgi:hypothetical protein
MTYLDSLGKRAFIFYMKATIVIIVLLSLAADRSFGQRQDLETLAPNAKLAAAQLSLQEDVRINQADVIMGKDFQFSGPLVRPFKSHKLREVPRRLLQLINPFASVEHKEEIEGMRDLSPRAWTLTVGWSTGRSSSPVEVTHEPTMGLVSVSTR